MRTASRIAISLLVVLAIGTAVAGARLGSATSANARYSPTGLYPTMTGSTPPSSSGNVRVDAEGIPIVHYDGVGWRRNPGTVAAFGLAWHAYFRASGERHALEMARKEADWLRLHQVRTTGTWLYRFPFEVDRGLWAKPPWASAYAQGVAISLLTRVWHLTKDRRYLAAALAAAKPLARPVAKEGLSASLFGHGSFFLEYPTAPPTLTVNGFMTTLVALYDLNRASSTRASRRLFADGIRTLRFALPLYDLPGGAQLYDLSHLMAPPREENVASEGYMSVDAALLRALTSVAPNPVFRFYAQRWTARSS